QGRPPNFAAAQFNRDPGGERASEADGAPRDAARPSSRVDASAAETKRDREKVNKWTCPFSWPRNAYTTIIPGGPPLSWRQFSPVTSRGVRRRKAICRTPVVPRNLRVRAPQPTLFCNGLVYSRANRAVEQLEKAAREDAIRSSVISREPL